MYTGKLNKVLSLFLLTCILFLFSQKSQAQDTLTVYLSGAKEASATHTNASGIVHVVQVGDSLMINGEFSNLEGYYTGAHIHMAAPRKEGNALIMLHPVLSEDKKSGKFKFKDNSFRLRDSLKPYLQKGMLYINITTNTYPTGEIRGQIVPAGA